MTNRADRLLIAVAFALATWSASTAFAQGAPAGQAGARQQGAAKPSVAAAPAPVRDLTGDWHGVPEPPRLNQDAQMTPWGQAIFDSRKTMGKGLVGNSNDPMIKCDPLGFPRDVLWETRGLEFIQLARKVVMLSQYQRVWREVWTDGRKLPTPDTVSKSDELLAEPRYYGYSIGHWADDYTFVADTINLDEDTWVDEFGHPHSEDAHVKEEYHRADHDTLQVTVTIDDPKAYKVPFVVADKIIYKWNPRQELDEQLCIPSAAEQYFKAIAGPAAADKDKK
jgi:hypothetical protein